MRQINRRRIIEGPPMDAHAEELAGRALDALVRVTELRRALADADERLENAARAFRRYYHDAA